MEPPSRRGPVPILALDVARLAEAFRWLEVLGPRVDWVKVGLQLFVAEGPTAVRALRRAGYRVFLDLKLHDIPNTVAGAVAAAADWEAELLTVHALGGPGMLRAAQAAARPPLRLLAVTALTSLGEEHWASLWGGSPTMTLSSWIHQAAALAAAEGLHGVVAPAAELAGVRAAHPQLAVLVPGLRPPGGPTHDQARPATPADVRAADYVVVGRAVTAAPDPVAAWDELVRACHA